MVPRPPRVRVRAPVDAFPAVHAQIVGDLDGDYVSQLDEEFRSLLEDQVLQSADWVLDLGDIDYLSSRYLGVLIAHQRRLAAIDHRMVLVVSSPWVRQKLELLGLQKSFLISHNQREALAMLIGEAQPTDRRVEVDFPGEFQACSAVRKFVVEMLNQAGASERDAWNVALITDELCNNAVEHGSANSGENVRLLLLFRDDTVVIEVTDRGGVRFSLPDSTASLKRHLQDDLDVPLRGRGLRLIRSIAKSLELRHEGALTRVKAVYAFQAPLSEALDGATIHGAEVV